MVLNRAFEYGGQHKIMLAAIGREAVVKKSHIADDQCYDARVAAWDVSALSTAHNQQSENTCRRITNNISPELSTAR